mgnify:FL=1
MGALRYGLFLLLAVVSAIEAGPALKMHRPQVNVRADATVQASRIAVLAQDVEVEALGRKDEWFRISLPDGREGWVHSRLVREIVVVTGEGVRLREAGSTTAPTVATAAKGEELGKVGERGNWFEIALADGGRGWIWKELVRVKTIRSVVAKVPEEQEAEIRPEAVVQEEAEPIVEEVVAPPPVLRRNIYAEGLQHAAAGEHQLALDLFNDVLDSKPDHLDALIHAARAHKHLGVYDRALDRLYQAMTLGEGRRDIYVTLAEVYRLGGVPDSSAKYLALFRGEKWEKPKTVGQDKQPEQEDDMPLGAWWIYGAGFVGALLLGVGGWVVVRLRRPRAVKLAKEGKEQGAKAAKGKFAKEMRQSRGTGTSGSGEEVELERQIQEKRADLQQSSAAFLGPNALGGGEDAHLEQIIGQVETLRGALEAQDERAHIYADIVRLQNAKIEAMEQELELLRRRGKG